jgi:hypothetical protein
MPRVIVTTGEVHRNISQAVLLDEQVASVHLSDSHSAAQLVQRLAWAVEDAERAERSSSPRRLHTTAAATPRRVRRTGDRPAVGAVAA